MLSASVLSLLAGSAVLVAAGGTVDPYNLPHTSESDQYGYNDCTKYGASPTANCQTVYLESLDDFCLWAPPKAGLTIGDTEAYEVAWCTKENRGARIIPPGTLTGAHLIRTKNYIQISGTLKGTKINISKGDDGGELDPRGADGLGNPHGGVVLSTVNGKLTQLKEWNSFISDTEFCIRACYNGPDAWRWCNHIYDVLGCGFSAPGSYETGSFDTCAADDTPYPPGEYPIVKNGKTSISTFHQGVGPTPAAAKPAKSSKCTKQATIAAASYTTKKITTTTKPKTTTTAKATKTTTSTAKAAGTSGATCKNVSTCSNPAPRNAVRACVSGKCGFTCNSGLKYNVAKTQCVPIKR